MDDTKSSGVASYRLTIAGQEYDFGPPDRELYERMVLVSSMNVDELLALDAVTQWLASSAGPATWRAIMRRFVHGEVQAADMLKAMEDLAQAIAEGAAVGGAEDAAADAA